ncbi:MAG: hypothetical protein BWX78_01849 [Firmicutes bacterium ADurb.Bin099]|nr:MAG: hypothetical protein BWX78_01849 [Firmicutes bacterium ADurb.Bin099]
MCGIQLIVLSGAAAITAKRYSMKEPLELLKGKRGKKKNGNKTDIIGVG